MKIQKSNRGAASVIMLFVMMVVLFSVLTVGQLAGGSILRSQNEVLAAQAFQTAQSGADYVYQKVISDAEAGDGTVQNAYLALAEVPVTLPSGATGGVRIQAFNSGASAWLTSEARVGKVSRSVRMLVTVRDVGIWNNAIFAGTGASGQAINGNVDIRGSVHLLGEGEAFTDFNGNGVRDLADPFTDLNGNGIWTPGEPFVDVSGDGSWTPAEPYNDSNGNGIYDPPLTVTEMNSSFSGNAHIGNNYNGMPSQISNGIPSIPVVNALRTLNTEVRVKHGLIKVQGSASVGQTSPAAGDKGSVEGTFVNDGFIGNPGAGGVTSDNGTGEKYDLGDRVGFPLISGIGADPYFYKINGQTYSTHEAFLNARSMTVNIPGNALNNNTVAFTLGPDAFGNSIQWIPASGANPARLIVNGIVKINGSLQIGEKNLNIQFDGRGTIYATQDINISSNLLPVTGKLFPTQTALGFIAKRNINLATGNGDSQLSMMGAFYAQGVVKSAKQNQIGGTFVGNFFDMGSNVPNIYQVPTLARNLPPGMPGADPIVSLRKRTWRERVVPNGS